MKKHVLAVLMAAFTFSASAQQVTTLYFLENAPMRHTINPAFQPYSKGYLNFSPLGWTSIGAGNNSLTLSDLLYVDPVSGKTFTVLNPDAKDRKALLPGLFRKMTYVQTDATLGLLNFGFRVREVGYVTIGVNERLSVGSTIPKSFFDLLLTSDKGNFAQTANSISIGGIGAGASLYLEIAGGYSHQINEQWTVGGKLKFLMGQAYASLNSKRLNIDASPEQWDLDGELGLDVAGPFKTQQMTTFLVGNNLGNVIDGFINKEYSIDSIIDAGNHYLNFLKPAGYGAAIDLGFTYKPLDMLQISASLNDLGFIYWTKGSSFDCKIDTVFNGVGEINYSDPAFRDETGKFNSQLLLDTVKANLRGMLSGVAIEKGYRGMAKMISARMNIGVDANFWENRVGVGVVSSTRLYNARLYEEVTIGASFRPVTWFSLAASYSLLENGKFSNIGAGLSIMPFDGINLTVAMDYIPTSYGRIKGKNILPDKTKMFNLALGFSICWGTSKRDKDKDGISDRYDLCPHTPRGVLVDSHGCPLDTDHDGVPDYLDHCENTIPEAIGFVDSVGCPLDTDGDEVLDYMDKCPNTPFEAWGLVDSVGCPLDTDGDGVEDYLDLCPNTPFEAWGKVNRDGCPIDSDDDGVPDYLDECPNTPEEARSSVDSLGCPIDSDKDGVPDYLDECPNTPVEAIGHINAKGCELDSDGDGVPDYLDECPMVAGLKENKGCPEVKREVRQLLQKAMQGIEFESGKATIKKKSFTLLDQIAKIFLENEDYIIEVQGHTDNVGRAELNQRVSEQRADAVMKYMISKGVAAERMTAIGYGDTQPIADNKTKEGRQKNRRVEFKISFVEVHYESVLEHADPAPAAPGDNIVAPDAEKAAE